MKNAFVYDWRLWTPPDLREAFEAAGFEDVHFLWEATDLEVHKPVSTSVHCWKHALPINPISEDSMFDESKAIGACGGLVHRTTHRGCGAERILDGGQDNEVHSQVPCLSRQRGGCMKSTIAAISIHLASRCMSC